MKIIDSIPIFGMVEDSALNQIKTCAKTAIKAALMADSHKGYAVPIGGIVTYRDAISPSGVGFDIACGNKAVLLDTSAQYVRERIGSIMDEVFKTLGFGIGRNNDEPIGEQPIFDKGYPGWDWKPLSR